MIGIPCTFIFKSFSATMYFFVSIVIIATMQKLYCYAKYSKKSREFDIFTLFTTMVFIISLISITLFI